MTTVHVCGFYDDADHPRLASANVTSCPDDETPHEAYVRIASNIEYFGGELEDVRRTWPLGGRRIDAGRIDFTTPAHDKTARMWHVISDAAPDPWAAKPDPVEAPRRLCDPSAEQLDDSPRALLDECVCRPGCPAQLHLDRCPEENR
jgi:hypothetical protein